MPKPMVSARQSPDHSNSGESIRVRIAIVRFTLAAEVLFRNDVQATAEFQFLRQWQIACIDARVKEFTDGSDSRRYE
jgi:hypothetical protein